MISTTTLRYLSDLGKNNNRDWFSANKGRYLAAKEEFKAFALDLETAMSEYDELEETKIYRIYRDVRFSKDKSPYKTHFSGYFRRATKWRRGGMYFHIEPGGSFAGGGFWSPDKEDLARIRQEIAADPTPLRNIISHSYFLKHFGELKGKQLKTAPRGYPKDHPAADLLRYKQFLIMESISDEVVASKEFIPRLVSAFRTMRPFFDYMSDVLTTDANGIPLWED